MLAERSHQWLPGKYNVMISSQQFLRNIVFLLLLTPQACRIESKEELPITPIDTTITMQEAFSRLTLDSNVIRNYIAGNPHMSDTAKQLFRNFYNSRNFQYAWFDESGRTEHAGMLWNLYQRYLDFTPQTAKPDSAFEEVMQRVITGDTSIVLDAETIRKAELNLTHVFFDYAFAAYIGSTKPEELQWYIPRRKVNVMNLLDSIIMGRSSADDDWEPVDPQYRLLRNQLISFKRLQQAGAWQKIDSLKSGKLEKGMRDSLVLQLKKRLFAVGKYPSEDTSLLFTDALRDSVKVVQQLFGLPDDGVVGESTVKALNIPIEQRIKQLLINLERVRWLPRRPSGDWLLVNIPSFRMRVYEGSSLIMQMKIVVGAAATKTVIFSDEMRYIVFSPYWNVPTSIVRSEILPAMRRNVNYLNKMHMEKTGTVNGLPVIRQRPGPGNALGQVKFVFPNTYNIYLHDTPAKSLFDESSRAFSHGCIRISEPFALARHLLRNNSAWTDLKIKKAMNAGAENWVNLKAPVPVFITYFTAWVDDQGRLQLRNDIYGHDQRMAKHLFKD